MSMAVVPILPALGGLLWEITTYSVTAGTAVAVAAAVASVAAIVECGLLL